MKYYAHTTKDDADETLLTFVTGECITAAQFKTKNGRPHRLDDLSEEQTGWQLLALHLVIYQQGTEQTRSSEFWGGDLNASDTFVRYYSRLFQLDSLDQPTHPDFRQFKINRDMRPKLAFEDAVKAFEVIDSATTAVFVGWTTRFHAIQRLKRLLRENRFEPNRLSRVLRMLHQFQVNLYEHEARKYRYIFEEIIPGVLFTSSYHPEYGLNLDNQWPQDWVC